MVLPSPWRLARLVRLLDRHGGCLLICFVGFAVTSVRDGPAGLIERLAFTAAFCWIVALAIQLLRRDVQVVELQYGIEPVIQREAERANTAGLTGDVCDRSRGACSRMTIDFLLV